MANRTMFVSALAALALGATVTVAAATPSITPLSFSGAGVSEHATGVGGQGSDGGLDASVDATAPVGIAALDDGPASADVSPARAAELKALVSAAVTLGAMPSPAVLSTLGAYQEAVTGGSGDAAGLLAVLAAKPLTPAIVLQVNAQLGVADEPETTAELMAEARPGLWPGARQ